MQMTGFNPFFGQNRSLSGTRSLNFGMAFDDTTRRSMNKIQGLNQALPGVDSEFAADMLVLSASEIKSKVDKIVRQEIPGIETIRDLHVQNIERLTGIDFPLDDWLQDDEWSGNNLACWAYAGAKSVFETEPGVMTDEGLIELLSLEETDKTQVHQHIRAITKRFSQNVELKSLIEDRLLDAWEKHYKRFMNPLTEGVIFAYLNTRTPEEAQALYHRLDRLKELRVGFPYSRWFLLKAFLSKTPQEQQKLLKSIPDIATAKESRDWALQNGGSPYSRSSDDRYQFPIK